MSRKPVAFTALLFIVTSLHAHKKEPINTEYAPPVENPILHLTPELFHLDKSVNIVSLPSIDAEIPLTRWIQFEAGIPVRLVDRPQGGRDAGIGDLEVGFRALLPHPERGPVLAFNFEAGLPTGRESLDAGEETELSSGIFATQTFQKAILFANFSYVAAFPGHGEGHENALEYSTAVVVPLREWLSPTLEVFGDSNLTARETRLMVAPELILGLNRAAELKVGVPLGVTGTSPDWGIQVRVSIFLSRDPR